MTRSSHVSWSWLLILGLILSTFPSGPALAESEPSAADKLLVPEPQPDDDYTVTPNTDSQDWSDDAEVSNADEAANPSATTEEAEAGTPESLIQDEPSFLVAVEVDREDRRYREGEPLRVSIVSEEDAYAYVLYQQADGKIYQIFPNSVQKDNHLSAGEEVIIPGDDDLFRWSVSKPFGKEILKVIAAKKPLEGLDDPELLEGRFNAIDAKHIKRAVKSLKAKVAEEDEIAWAEAQVEITTHSRDEVPVAPTGKRYGVFFGVSEYEFNDVVEEISDGESSLNLANCANDALAVGLLMSNLGKLDDYRTYVNSEATRRNMELAITNWLPSVSKPGDTVFIFFSGHGGQIPDDNRDESDGQDEWLMTHDCVTATSLAGLFERANADKLDPSLMSRYNAWMALAKRAGSIEKADEWLSRATGVSDDLFGHWLQRLSGRRIVIILDSCHSGGMATHEKSLGLPNVKIFDFLNSEVGRLKDIGQPESALLAACRFDELAQGMRATDQMLAELRATGEETAGLKGSVDEWVDGATLSVLAYYFVEGLLEGERPMKLDGMFTHCHAGMREYFAKLNEIRAQQGEETITPHEPVLINYSANSIVVKP